MKVKKEDWTAPLIGACVTLALAAVNYLYIRGGLPSTNGGVLSNGFSGLIGVVLFFCDMVAISAWEEVWSKSPLGIRFAAWKRRLPAFSAKVEGPASPKSKVSEAPAPGKARLIGEGSFRVDRERAIDVLSKFQLHEPQECVLAFVRWAVLSGARDIRFTAVPAGFELRFDGAPLSPGQLQDPYAPLFNERPASGEAGRFLAFGLLAAQRLGPKRISLSSGRGLERHTLWIESGEQSSQGNLPGEETVLRIVWNFRLEGAIVRGSCMKLVRERCGLVLAELKVDGKPVAKVPRAQFPALAFEEGGLRGVIGVYEAGNLLMDYNRGVVPSSHPVSRTRLYRQGVQLGGDRGVRLPLVQGEIDINDDAFTLDASHARVITDARYEDAEKFLKSLPPRLIMEAARVQAERYPGLDPDKTLTGTFLRHLSHNNDFWRWEDSVTAWLREAAASLLTEYAIDCEQPHLKALWETPLFFKAKEGVLSMRGLSLIEERKNKISATFVARHLDSADPDLVWCPTERAKAFLVNRFKVKFIG